VQKKCKVQAKAIGAIQDLHTAIRGPSPVEENLKVKPDASRKIGCQAIVGLPWAEPLDPHPVADLKGTHHHAEQKAANRRS